MTLISKALETLRHRAVPEPSTAIAVKLGCAGKDTALDVEFHRITQTRLQGPAAFDKLLAQINADQDEKFWHKRVWGDVGHPPTKMAHLEIRLEQPSYIIVKLAKPLGVHFDGSVQPPFSPAPDLPAHSLVNPRIVSPTVALFEAYPAARQASFAYGFNINLISNLLGTLIAIDPDIRFPQGSKDGGPP